jgi:hypothetical protein
MSGGPRSEGGTMRDDDQAQASFDRLTGLAGRVGLMLGGENVSRGEAACALLSVAMSILVEDLGEVAGAEFAQSSIDEALAIWRHGQGRPH